MATDTTGSFLTALLAKYPDWQAYPVVETVGDGWHGAELAIEPPVGSDLYVGLEIEEVAGEITISYDHSHIHMSWPPVPRADVDPMWWDAMAFVSAVLQEKIIAASGWIESKLRAGGLQEAVKPVNLLVPGLDHIRIRSWQGTFDRDERF